MSNTYLVLVVEDETIIRLGMVEALHLAGFDLAEAGDAHEALELLETDHHRIHAVFSDVQMPGTIDGIGLVHHVAQHWPAIVLMIASAQPLARLAALPTACRYLQKPYDTDIAIKQVQELLAG